VSSGTATEPAAVADPGSGVERRRALHGGLWLAAAQVLPMATALVLSVAIERTLGKTALGLQGFVALVSSLLVTLVIGSVSATGVQVLAAARTDARLAARRARLSDLALTCAGALCAAALLAFGAGAEQLQVVWAIAAGTAMVDAVGTALQTRVVAAEGWGRVGARRLVSQVLASVLGIAALLAGAGIPGVFAAQALAATVLLLVLVPLVREVSAAPGPAGPPEPAPALPPASTPAVKAIGVLAAGFFAANLLVTLLERRIEGLFLGWFSTPDQYAAYSVAFNLFTVGYFACGALIFAAMPSISALAATGELARIHESLGRAARLVLASSVLLGAGIASVGPTTVLVLYDDLPEAAALVPWICLALVPGPLAALARVYWSGLGRLRPVLLTGALGLAVDVGVALALVPSLGAGGAVAANLAGVTTGAVALLAHTRRRWGGLGLTARAVLGPCAVAAPAAAAAVAVAAAVGGVLGLLASGTTFCVVALAVGQVVRVAEADDVAWLAGAVPGRAGPLVRWVGAPHVAGAIAGARARRGSVGP
jgi:O-antigen/teichoic acid export membrane protein